MTTSYCVDANIFITSWNTVYPRKVFPGLWEKLAQCNEQIILIKPIFDEIDPITDKSLSDQQLRDKNPLRMWLLNNGFVSTSIDPTVDAQSLQLEEKYQPNKNSKGANQNDIKLIAYAKNKNISIVSFEKKQVQSPIILSRCNIPTICEKENVQTLEFVEMLEQLNVVI